jgi:alpha-L-glutamate ligase-like protein
MLYKISKPHWILIIISALILGIHQFYFPLSQGDFTPQRLYQLTLNASFSDDEESVNVHTYLPHTDQWQTVLKENVSTTAVASSEQLLPSGRLLTWSAEEGQHNVGYKVLVFTQGQQFTIENNLFIPKEYPDELNEFLQTTQHIQFQHPEILTLWESIRSGKQDIYSVLDSIYQHTWKEIENLPFKGTTDALTAARLGAASCNGKSRLFVALARLNNLPARLVGGLILENARKKTSHQWIEVYINGHWVTFDPTNGYFAERPSHYLRLYEGDKALFRHTSNIGFDYEFAMSEKIVSAALHPQLMSESTNYLPLSRALSHMHLSSNTLAIILLFPFCTLLITFLRNILGVKTFGIFMPILVAATCMYTGLLTGLVGFISILTLAWACHTVLERLRILKTARLAIVISVVSILFILVLWFSAVEQKLEFGMLALMPVVIISFVAERIHQVTQEKDWKALISNSTGSLVTIALCYLYITSFHFQSLFILYPETYLLVLAGLIMIGSWDGIRASELLRFKHLGKEEKKNLLGINSRNLNLVYRHNSKDLLMLATDKLASKEVLTGLNIPVPKTLLEIRNHQDLSDINESLMKLDAFVIKPNAGSQGKGILVIRENTEQFIGASGKSYTLIDLKKHIKEILIGHFSQCGDQDVAYIEPLIRQDKQLNTLSNLGLSDIRVILGKGQIVSAMLRVPTTGSNGKANLHQGAIGISVDIHTGKTQSAMHKGKPIFQHPDSGSELIGFQVPYWDQICEMAKNSFHAIPLGYLGVDICIDEKIGPLVLEVNGRAGLEIQNVQQQGLRQQLLEAVEAS